jgi:hypothetical protein
MRAVWSYWSKPNRVHRHWRDERSHLLSWALSVETARKHYPECALVTDSDGARLLVKELGLPFTDVSTALDALDDVPTSWWAMGKLWAYRAQRAPFVHLDSDVYLWSRLPDALERAPVLAQSPEGVGEMGGVYQPARLRSVLRARGGWVPAEWDHYLAHGGAHAANCGIVGGNDVELLRHYASVAIEVALHRLNHAAWADERMDHNPLVEQYLLCACVDHRGLERAAPLRPRIEYLFPTGDTRSASQLGYTHLIYTAKSNPDALARLARRVAQDYPHHHRRCVELTSCARAADPWTLPAPPEPNRARAELAG